MQIAAEPCGAGASQAPAVVTPTSKRFYSAEAAAKHWASDWGVVVRPGGYLHSPSPKAYAFLPDLVKAPEGTLAFAVDRLYDHDYRCGVKGWVELAVILVRNDMIFTRLGPRGATQYYLKEQS